MPQQKQAPESFVDFRFPIKGIDLSQAYSLQPADTTPIGQNVRAYDALQARARGGSRPGLAKYVSAIVGPGGLIQELNSLVGVGYTPPGPTGTQGFVQGSAGNTGTGSLTDTFAAPTAAGNGILVIVGIANGAFPSAVTDAAGNTYTQINSSSISSCAISAWLATGAASVSGVTATISGAYTGVSITSFEVAAPATSDVQALKSSNGSPGTSNTLTTTFANDFAYLAVQTTAGGAVSGGPGGAWILPGSGATGRTFLPAYQNLYALVTNLTGTWTFTGAPFWSSIIGSFRV